MANAAYGITQMPQHKFFVVAWNQRPFQKWGFLNSPCSISTSTPETPLLATSFPEEGLNHVPEISDT
jgi:hypothetical protein